MEFDTANSIEEINKYLKTSMASRTIQHALKNDQLNILVDRIVYLGTQGGNAKDVERLKATASLARLAAVFKSRQNEIFCVLSDILIDEPCDIEDLSDGDEKYYAAQALNQVEAEWLTNYVFQQSVKIDTAENTRKALIQIGIERTNDLALGWQAASFAFAWLKSIENLETRMRRSRRISTAWSEIIKEWDGNLCQEGGEGLAQWLKAMLISPTNQVDDEILIDLVNDVFSMLIRMIELRFSLALEASTYQVLEIARARVPGNTWLKLNRDSSNLKRIKLNLLEAALVLANQNRTDDKIMRLLNKAYYSKTQSQSALREHFLNIKGLDPDIKDWWLQGGKVQRSEDQTIHKVGNTEDQYIGSLLLHVETSRNFLEKLDRAVVPFLEISDPPLASTVKKANESYSEISRISRQLARMRKLTNTSLVGEVIEYNPRQHDMLGGHQYGVRQVRVVRDGVEKDYAGKIKMLVKPWVEVLDEN